MTRYNTPAEGTLDWHVPLNENFTQLETDVEIRDAESNRDQYPSSDGAKFLATDTGAVYIGDGSQWNYLGDVVPERSGESGESNLAQPGEVQTAIDNVAAAGGDGGRVKLDPTQVYPQPSSPWVVKSDVELDFNGAWVYGGGDKNNTDIIHLAPGGRLLEPRVNLYNGGNGYDGSNTYNGTIFHLNTQYGRYFAYGTAIRGGYIAAVGGGGTACKLTVAEPRTWITHMTLQYDIGTPQGVDEKSSVENGVFLDTIGAGDDGWINGVTVNGHWRYPETGILQDGVQGKYNQQQRNTFYVQIQPAENGNGAWEIRDPTWSERNVLYGLVWDFYTVDGPIWKIDSEYQDPDKSWRGCQHNAIHSLNDLRPEHVRNNSPNNHYIGRPENFSVRTV